MVDEFERTPSQRIMKHKLSRRTDDAWDAAAEAKRDGQVDPSKAQGE